MNKGNSSKAANLNRERDMDTKTITITNDEAEDIRFALGQLANEDTSKASALSKSSDLRRALMEQADRFRQLAQKVSA